MSRKSQKEKAIALAKELVEVFKDFQKTFDSLDPSDKHRFAAVLGVYIPEAELSSTGKVGPIVPVKGLIAELNSDGSSPKSPLDELLRGLRD